MTHVQGVWFPQIYEATKNNVHLKKIDRLKSVSDDQFTAYASKSLPFVVKNVFNSFNKRKAKQILKSDFGSQQIEVRYGVLDEAGIFLERKTSKNLLGDYLKILRDKSNEVVVYAGNNNVELQLLEALNITYPPFYQSNFYNIPRMWFGPKKAVTPLHKDITDNFSYNYFGKKKWIIYPPSDYPYLYMADLGLKDFPDFELGAVDIFKPDLSKFPEFNKARGIEVIMHSHELLYLPAGWSHHVINLEETLMFNFWLLRDKSPAVLGKDE